MKRTTNINLLGQLLQGKYLMPATNHNGITGFKLYTGKQVPVGFFPASGRQYKTVKGILRKDRKGRYLVNINSIRQLHGNDSRRKFYNQFNRNA
jgi:hypothetical protein